MVKAPQKNPVMDEVGRLYQEWVGDLRGRLRARATERRLKWGDVAADANLCFATVSNFAHEITRKPHGETLFRIAVAIGLMPPGWSPRNEPMRTPARKSKPMEASRSVKRVQRKSQPKKTKRG